MVPQNARYNIESSVLVKEMLIEESNMAKLGSKFSHVTYQIYMFSALGGALESYFGIVKSYSVLSDNTEESASDVIGLIGYVSAKRNCRYLMSWPLVDSGWIGRGSFVVGMRHIVELNSTGIFSRWQVYA